MDLAGAGITPRFPEQTAQPAIEVANVTVAYRAYRQRPSSLKETVLKLLHRGRLRHFETFDALKDVSFKVAGGSVLGIIGSNGSGKSTLLKVIAQVLRPTRGSAVVRGNISSLIELGVGFDPELNAVENIYLNGSLHRRSRAYLRKRVDHIISFAELGEFASTPVKYYSSGMAARLGFSVAVDIDPDVLLVDEILGVGDERFQQKCQAVFRDFIAARKTIVIVSHDLDMLAGTANQIALLSRGQIAYMGDPRTAVALYRDKSYETTLG